MMLRVLPAIILLLLAASISCGGQGEAGPKAKGVDASGLTPKNFFPRLEEALTRGGFVFHTSTETVVQGFVDAASVQSAWDTEVWLDVGQRRGRMEFTKDPSLEADLADSLTGIVLGNTIYTSVGDHPQKGEARVCPGMESRLLALLIFNCEALKAENFEPPPQVARETVKAEVEYEGQPAVAVIYEKLWKNEDGPRVTGERKLGSVTSGFYVHRESFLPLAWVAQHRDDTGRLLGALITRYESEFVALSSLSSDFFDPASIGYVEKDQGDPLDDPQLGVVVYWLGRKFMPSGDLPPLVLSKVHGTQPPLGGPGDRASLNYTVTEPRLGPGVYLQLWLLQDWQDFLKTPLGRLWWDSPCVQTKEVSLEHGRAVIFMGYEPEAVLPAAPVPATPSGEETRANAPAAPPVVAPSPTPSGKCATGPFNRFLAHVYLGDTVVAVNAPLCLACARRGYQPDLYDTPEGMVTVVAGLRPRAAGE